MYMKEEKEIPAVLELLTPKKDKGLFLWKWNREIANLNRETPKLGATQVHNSPMAIIKQEIDEGMDAKKKKKKILPSHKKESHYNVLFNC